MKNLILIVSLFVSVPVFSSDQVSSAYPHSPDANMTPGSLCVHESEIRYPERIRYCTRSVGGSLKKDVIRNYDERLGYSIRRMNRQEFKIDHYIPLCMGGSNESDNLWPQHKTIYKYTDSLEALLCVKMREGHLLQAKAIEYIKRAKASPETEARAVLKELDSLPGE